MQKLNLIQIKRYFFPLFLSCPSLVFAQPQQPLPWHHLWLLPRTVTRDQTHELDNGLLPATTQIGSTFSNDGTISTIQATMTQICSTFTSDRAASMTHKNFKWHSPAVDRKRKPNEREIERGYDREGGRRRDVCGF